MSASTGRAISGDSRRNDRVPVTKGATAFARASSEGRTRLANRRSRISIAAPPTFMASRNKINNSSCARCSIIRSFLSITRCRLLEHILYAFHQSMFHSGSNLFFGACKLLISLTFSARLMRAFLEQCNGLFEERAAAVRCCGALIAGSLESTVVRALVQVRRRARPQSCHLGSGPSPAASAAQASATTRGTATGWPVERLIPVRYA